jgi:hypothetical protein
MTRALHDRHTYGTAVENNPDHVRQNASRQTVAQQDLLVGGEIIVAIGDLSGVC